MALKVDYVVRETATNLTPQHHPHARVDPHRRRVAGARRRRAFLLSQGVDNATDRWQGRHRVHRLHEARRHPGAEGRGAGATSTTTPRSSEVDYVDQDEAYEEFKELFADQPELHRDGRRPRSCRRRSGSCPSTKDADVVAGAGRARSRTRPACDEVVFATEAVQRDPGDLQQDRRRASSSSPSSCCSSPPACSSSTRSAWRCSPGGARSR